MTSQEPLGRAILVDAILGGRGSWKLVPYAVKERARAAAVVEAGAETVMRGPSKP